AKLDPFDLLLIEQPLPEHDVRGHAELAKRIRTPVCLDESIESAKDAAEAIALGACAIVNIKPGRVGGYLEARRVHDVCAANDIPRIEAAFQARLDESLEPRGPDSVWTEFARLSPRPGEAVVDVGCGEGDDAIELARRFGLRVHGVDPVQRHVDLATEAAPAE